MSWIAISISAYFLGAFAVLLDKFLISSKRFSSAQVYTFYIGIMGLGALMFAPFGFVFPSWNQIFLSLVSGIIYMAGIFALYEAIGKAEASRVTPVVFSVVPLATYAISFVWGDKMNAMQVIGAALLVFGGLLISFDLPLKLNKRKFFAGFYLSCLSGIFLAISYVLFKLVYESQTFLNGFMWTRIGAFVGVLLMFLVPSWRKAIFASFHAGKKNRKKHLGTGTIFVGNKIMGGVSSILLNKAFQVGSVTLVNSMVSLQYVFVLVLAALISKKHPKVFEEKLKFWDWMQKIAAIFVIAIGMYLIV
jgi:drug/metabolite transporter (DMT)-like permease